MKWWKIVEIICSHVILQPEAANNAMEDVSTDEHSDFFIEITVSEPQKIGEGIGSYLAYKWVRTFFIRWSYTQNHLITIYYIEQSDNTHQHSEVQSETIQHDASIQWFFRIAWSFG